MNAILIIFEFSSTLQECTIILSLRKLEKIMKQKCFQKMLLKKLGVISDYRINKKVILTVFRTFILNIKELLKIETSEIYIKACALNNEFVDDREFSFSSIGEEFDFEVGMAGNESSNACIEYEELDLIFESSQNFY